MKMDTGAKS